MYSFLGHLETIFFSLLRKQKPIQQAVRTVFVTTDGDLIEIDEYTSSSTKAVILIHGLESSSSESYIIGMANLFLRHHFSVLCINLRGCGGSPNLLYESYHSGATSDIKEIVDHYSKRFSELYMIGFSLGGNLLLKYMGEYPSTCIKKGIAISTPLDLSLTVRNLEKKLWGVYRYHFTRKLKRKLYEKQKLFPSRLERSKIHQLKTLQGIDDYYTAPAHGFANAEHYYKTCSSMHFLEKINRPTLIINALNDPFYTGLNYQKIKEQINHSYIEWDLPKSGGHVGFGKRFGKIFYHEEKSLAFLLRNSD